MPSKQLRIDGNSGVVGIVAYGNASAAFSNPFGNINDVYFHTSLPYLQLKGSVEGTVTFGQVDQAYYTYDSGGGGCGGGC